MKNIFDDDDDDFSPFKEDDFYDEEDFKPLTIEDFIDKHTTQLQIDAINVLEKRVDIMTFPKEYQQTIKNYYRFTPIDVGGRNGSGGGGRSSWK
jgi:hypothetical protein